MHVSLEKALLLALLVINFSALRVMPQLILRVFCEVSNQSSLAWLPHLAPSQINCYFLTRKQCG